MIFPLRFQPAGWSGPRATQHADRSDAFQQLVGDLLREQFGSRASVSPTETRDGSIDAFVEDEMTSSGLANVLAPQIIECKDHDDGRDDYLGNINAGWSRVAEKLRRCAASGWPGLFAPWRRAKSYLYCISAVLPSQEHRERLRLLIANFFDALPEGQRPPLEHIGVVDWSDLRDLLDRYPRLADRWLGTGLPLVLGHAEFCASFKHFQRYLLSGYFPFVEPDRGADSHPKVILGRLAALAGRSGVILKGIGGIGKTRTALEVGHQADVAGWRVLHALPGEPGVTVEDLVAAALVGNDPTLVIFDYLDQMPRLDLGSLRRRFLPEAESRGIRVALLANLRPSSLRRPNAEREALFTDEVVVNPSSRQRAEIKALTLDRIAPAAVAHLGADRVRELCGERPIIAMFIAEELQRRTENGTFPLSSAIDFRRGDLLSWLRRRLIEDKLIIPDADTFPAAEPEPPLVAAAAMLAAAPLVRTEMEKVGRSACCDAAGQEAEHMTTRVLETLLMLGWLEPRGRELSSAHDVVADEVVAQVLWERASGRLRESLLHCWLAPALRRPRVLGRYAVALARLLGPEAAETETEAGLRVGASHWLHNNRRGLGQLLASAEADESAYALGAVVGSAAWSAACIAAWGELVEPWIAKHGTDTAARHLLYKGLKEVPAYSTERLIVAALNWSSGHQHVDISSYVLAPLLARSDLEAHAPRAITLAIGWLEKFPFVQEAQFVLGPLLARSDLETHASGAVALAMHWLEKFALLQEAQFVLHPLLARRDLERHAPPAITLAMGWLGRFPLLQEAQFVLGPLLARNDLEAHASRAITLAMGWLEKFPLLQEAQFVLAPLLARSDLEAHASRAFALAMDWLEKFPLLQEAQFVFHPLLARGDLEAHAPRAVTLAMGWLEKFPLLHEAQFVFNPLLARSDLEARAPRAINLAMAWLEKFPFDEDAEYVLKRLFGLPGLTRIQRFQCVSIALPHLKRLGSRYEASHLLKGCLRERELDPDSAREVIRVALEWVKGNAQADTADYVFNRLLRRRDLAEEDWHDVAQIALRWLRNHDSRDNRDLSLAALLNCAERMQKDDLHWVLQQADEWLANPPPRARSPQKLLNALERYNRRNRSG